MIGQTCKSCKRPIVWLRTTSGKSMPADASSVGPDDAVFDRTKHISHFATCPNADKHRNPRK